MTHKSGASDRETRPQTVDIVATLWVDNPDIAFSLPLLLEHVGVDVRSVETPLDALDVAARSNFLIIDCATAADAWERCTAIITRTSIDIYVCHPNAEFVADLKQVALGKLYWLPPALTGLDLFAKLRIHLATRPHSPAVASYPLSPLTTREREVQRLVAQGCTNGEIAARLGITVRTVKNHVANGRRTLGVRTRKDFGDASRRPLGDQTLD